MANFEYMYQFKFENCILIWRKLKVYPDKNKIFSHKIYFNKVQQNLSIEIYLIKGQKPESPV